MMRRAFVQLSKRFAEKPMPLGRWSMESQEIKGVLANIDCCGDTLCGDPHTSKKAIDIVVSDMKRKEQIEKMKEHENYYIVDDTVIIDRNSIDKYQKSS